MLIQPILFPPQNFMNEPELFFRGIDGQNISDNISVPAGSTVSLETYFNAFSVGKWVEYSKINNLSLNLEIQGEVEIKAFHAVGTVDAEFFKKGKGDLTEKEYISRINSQAYGAMCEETPCAVIHEENQYSVKFQQLYKDGILFVTIKAVTDSILCRGGYGSEIDEPELNPVKLAVGICTYKREEAATGNINCLLKDIICNPDSPLKDKLEIYVADNGQTFDLNKFGIDKVHILPNPNLGGVGGFTRTMIEALVYDKAKNFSHIIFMDDDIMLYPAVFERTYYLLCLLKPKYQRAILGASMFLVDYPSVQQEIGALYKDFVAYIGQANHKFFDMRNPAAVSANEVVNSTNYTGWWYACIPQAIATESNLPMPYFIHYDDVEYGIRNINNGQIFINGICVWHPAPDNKGPFWITYYNVRNRLVTMFSGCLSRKSFVKYLLANSKQFLFHITRYDYKRASLILEALKDFLKGPQAFIEQDALALHQKLAGSKITFISPEEAGVDRNSIVRHHHKNFLVAGIIQLFCNLLPAKDSVWAVDGRYFNIPYRAKKLYIYDDKSDKGYILERSQKVFFKLFFAYNSAAWRLFWRYKGLLHDWQGAKPTLTSLSFWEKYLGLEHKE